MLLHGWSVLYVLEKLGDLILQFFLIVVRITIIAKGYDIIK